MSERVIGLSFFPCAEGQERCAVDGVECECERLTEEQAQQEERHNRMGPSPTVCRVMANFCRRLGNNSEAEVWDAAARESRSEGNA